MLSNTDTVVASRSGQLSTELEGEVVILSLIDEVYYGLDGVGARIWELIQEPRTVASVAQAICDEYDVEPEGCTADIRTLLNDLVERSLVDVTSEPGT